SPRDRLTEIFSIGDKQTRESASDAYHVEVMDELAGEGKPFAERRGEIATGPPDRDLLDRRQADPRVRLRRLPRGGHGRA
ncbi:hypothetical protein D9C01_13800, partial [Corynebacterium diphtheriae]